MSENYRPNRITSKKVWICVIAGLFLLLMCLAITSGYFDPNQEDRPSFVSFAKNLANSLDNSSGLLDGLKDWLFDGIGNLGQYLHDNVPWPPILLTIFAFIAFCYAIFQILKAVAQMIGKGDMAPFNWDLKSEVMNRLGVDQLFEKLNNFSSGPPSPKGEQIAEDTTLQEIVDLLKDAKSGPFLFLIDKLAPNDHFAIFWNTVAIEIEKKGINSDRYYFHGDPRLCYNEDHEEGIILENLAELHPDAVLIIIGDGNMLLQKSAVRLQPWSTQLEKWTSRYILSPKNYFEWDKREEELKQVFHALPAKLSSVQYLIHRPNQAGASFQYPVEQHAKEFIIDYQEDGIDHQNTFIYFEPPALDWIRACALYPSLHFDLTLEIGEKIFDAYNGQVPPEEQVPFNAVIILSVFELKWFREGLIPNYERSQLGAQLEKKEPKLSNAIRAFLAIFPWSPPPKDSYPGYKHEEFLWINQWLNRDHEVTKIERKEFKKQLNWIYFLGFWPDIFLFNFDGPHKRISKHIKWPSLRKFIFNFGISGLGLTQHFINICWSIFSGLFLLGTYLLIIWLSRPVGEDICMPVTKTFKSDGINPITVGFKGSKTKPVSAFIYGSGNGESAFSLKGSDVVVTNQDGTRRLNGNNGTLETTLGNTDTLRFLIRDSLSITTNHQFDLTIMACLNDSVGYNVGCPDNTDRTWNTSYTIHPNPPVRHFWSHLGQHRFQTLSNNYEYNGVTHIYRGTSPDIHQGELNNDDCPIAHFLFLLKDPGPNSLIVLRPPGERIPEPIIPGPTIPGDDLIDSSSIDTTTVILEYIDKSILEYRPYDTVYDTIYEDTLIIYERIRESIEIRDSIRIRDSINIIDTNVVPKMIISGNLIHCTENDVKNLVSAKRIPQIYVADGLNREVLTIQDQNSRSFHFAYEANKDTTINLVFSLPDNSPFNFVSNNSKSIKMIDGASSDFELEVFDSTYATSKLVNLLGDFIVACDRGNLLELEKKVSENLNVFYINSRGQKIPINHQNGKVCQDINQVDYCNSMLQIEYDDKIVDKIYLREYEVRFAGTADAVIDLKSQFIKSTWIACS